MRKHTVRTDTTEKVDSPALNENGPDENFFFFGVIGVLLLVFAYIFTSAPLEAKVHTSPHLLPYHFNVTLDMIFQNRP